MAFCGCHFVRGILSSGILSWTQIFTRTPTNADARSVCGSWPSCQFTITLKSPVGYAIRLVLTLPLPNTFSVSVRLFRTVISNKLTKFRIEKTSGCSEKVKKISRGLLLFVAPDRIGLRRVARETLRSFMVIYWQRWDRFLLNSSLVICRPTRNEQRVKTHWNIFLILHPREWVCEQGRGISLYSTRTSPTRNCIQADFKADGTLQSGLLSFCMWIMYTFVQHFLGVTYIWFCHSHTSRFYSIRDWLVGCVGMFLLYPLCGRYINVSSLCIWAW